MSRDADGAAAQEVKGLDEDWFGVYKREGTAFIASRCGAAKRILSRFDGRRNTAVHVLRHNAGCDIATATTG